MTRFRAVGLFLLLLTQTGAVARAQTIDLTGIWQDDTRGGGIYRLRQVGNRAYWIVDGTPMRSYVNLFSGEITGNSLAGIWVDLPDSPTLGGGNLTLRIESNDRLVKVDSSAYYGAQAWFRQGASNAPSPRQEVAARHRPSLAVETGLEAMAGLPIGTPSPTPSAASSGTGFTGAYRSSDGRTGTDRAGSCVVEQ